MNRLTDKEKTVLTYALTQANQSAQVLAEQCGLQARSVRRALSLLQEKEVFRRRSIITNLSVVGYTRYCVTARLQKANDVSRRKLIVAAQQQDGISELSELGSNNNFEIEVFARSAVELSSILESLEASVGSSIAISNTRMERGAEFYGFRGFAFHDKNIPRIKYTSEEQTHTLDESEAIVLSGLANKHYKSIEELAKLLGMPPSTVSHKISTLEKKKVISGHFYVTDSSVAGFMQFFVQVKGMPMDQELSQSVRDLCSETSSVVYLDTWLGEITHTIYISVSSFKEAQKFLHKLQGKIQPFNAIAELVPQLEFVVYSAFPFLREENSVVLKAVENQ